jgi:hypothetical protein
MAINPVVRPDIGRGLISFLHSSGVVHYPLSG